MCLNMFIQFIKAEKLKQLGFSGHDGTNHLFNLVHWFQFADDCAVIPCTEQENHLLTMMTICLPLKHSFQIYCLKSVLYQFFLRINYPFIKHIFSPKSLGTSWLPTSPKPGSYKV